MTLYLLAERVVSRIFASWNQLSLWLRRLADLRPRRVDLIDGARGAQMG